MKKSFGTFIFWIFTAVVLLPLLTIVLLAIGRNWIYPQLLPKRIDILYYFRMLFTNAELIKSLEESIYLALGTIIFDDYYCLSNGYGFSILPILW
jgi:hypothetical protein